MKGERRGRESASDPDDIFNKLELCNNDLIPRNN